MTLRRKHLCWNKTDRSTYFHVEISMDLKYSSGLHLASKLCECFLLNVTENTFSLFGFREKYKFVQTRFEWKIECELFDTECVQENLWARKCVFLGWKMMLRIYTMMWCSEAFENKIYCGLHWKRNKIKTWSM